MTNDRTDSRIEDLPTAKREEFDKRLDEKRDEIYDEFIASRIWPGTRALAQAHLDSGI